MRTCSTCINLKAKKVDGTFKVRCVHGVMDTDTAKYRSIDSIINLNTIRYFNKARECNNYKDDQ